MQVIRRLTSILMLSAAVLIAGAEEPSRVGQIFDVLSDIRTGQWLLADQAYGNPAVNQWRLSGSITEIDGEFISRTDSDNPDPRDGDGIWQWQLRASTYTRYRTSTLWGDASYSNGKTSGVVWNETADSELLYPYLMADSIGGDLKNERYSFHGGYADHTDNWAWGAELSYTALQQYRDVDPRPRNVSGTLDISAGVMRRIFGSYFAGIRLGVRKYKQTNDIDFKSEMGVDKIFHLTGLGNHYTRFDGTGLSAYYDGMRYGAGLDLYPASGRGWFATCSVSRFSVSNILSDLNKLPMASLWHRDLSLQCGWLSGEKEKMWGGASGTLELYRRHGSENLFGDAASSIYPLIGSNEMYADNAVTLRIDGRMGLRITDRCHINLHLSPGWLHRTTAYVEPYSYRVVNQANIKISAAATLLAGRHWMLYGCLGVHTFNPYHCRLCLTDTDAEMAGLLRAEQASYALDTSRSTSCAATISANRSIAGRYALGITGEWQRVEYHHLLSRNIYNISINFTF